MKNLIKKFKSGFILLPFLIISISLFSQEGATTYFTISGTVRDAVTGNPVPFASISLVGSHTGMVSNLDGYFTLKVPASVGYPDESLIRISHLGYKSADQSVYDIPEGGKDFLIEPQAVSIPEVVIRPADARSIVEAALKKVEMNYPVAPYMLTGFYRETIKQRRDYISISEAVVDIYQSAYNSSQTDMFRIIRGRKSGNVKKNDTLLVKLQGGPHVSMLLDIIKNSDLLLSLRTLKYYHFSLVDIINSNDGSKYVIEFSPRSKLSYPLYFGKLYISVDEVAITMAEFSLDLSDKDKAAQNFILRKPARLRFNPVKTRYFVNYKKIDDRYHVDYMRYELEFFADWRRRLFRTGYTIISEMAITARKSENVERFKQREAFQAAAVLADQVPVYFKDQFWGEYNYIEPDQSIHAAIKKLNRKLDW